MASVLYALAGKLAGELFSPLFKDYVGRPLELGTKSELKKLNNTLKTIQGVLLDADERQKTSNEVRLWLERIKLAFYDLEDLLQEVNYEALKRQVLTKNKNAKEVRIFFSSSNQIMYRLKMGRKVKLIIENLDAIAESNKFSLAQRFEEMPATTSHKREETHSFVLVDKFIGREKDKEKVKNLLLKSDGINNVSVISVVGIGGMGKTTLAQSIYNLEEVKGNFELMMWVCVSDPFDLKQICENIIKSATQNQCEGLPLEVVQNKLRSLIDCKKYLLVLDDVWNDCPKKWMKLEELLMGGAKGSKIIITTRQKLVAQIAKSIEVHVLEGLPHDKSWDLFKQVAFKQGVEPENSTIVGIGKEVVERCAGVPLVIKTTGSLLGLKEREADWVDFKKNDLPLVTKDSEGEILPILKLSYDNLTAPLKRCFAYCAIFPKDWEIRKNVLIRMWMGLGLIQLDDTLRSLEDVGEKYFMELMDRSLFEVDEKDEDGTIHRCKMHDLIHDLALSIGGNEFWSDGSDVNCIDVRTRHAWFSNPGPSLSTNLTQAKKLRTLVARKPFHENKKVVTGDFKQLRVLDFCYLNAARVLEFVAGLRVLTYLDLSNSDFELLPECLCNMYNLQTLILVNCSNLKELPKGTRNLVSLRHLDVSLCFELSHMPRGMGELTNLRTLRGDFVMGPEGANCSELGELKSLVNLRGKLTIRNLRGSKVGKRRSSGKRCNPTHPLTELQFITGLEFEWKEDGEEEEADHELEILKPHPNLEELKLLCYGGKRIPSWMERANIGDSLPNIRSIHIQRCKGWRHLTPLGLLPSLRELWLDSMGDLEYLIYDDKEEDAEGKNNRYFPALEKLTIRNCPLLEYIYDKEEDVEGNKNNWYFPALEELWIENCSLLVVDGKQFMSLREVALSGDNMETLPGWLQSLPHLQYLLFYRCQNMVSLPEWMGDLKSLQEIRLRDCDSLASIPDCVLHHLTSLQRLYVQGCPEFHRRYNKESGEDWHQISHIPNVVVFW